MGMRKLTSRRCRVAGCGSLCWSWIGRASACLLLLPWEDFKVGEKLRQWILSKDVGLDKLDKAAAFASSCDHKHF